MEHISLSPEERTAVETVKTARAKAIHAKLAQRLPEARFSPHSQKLARVVATVGGEKILDAPVSKMIFLDERLASDFIASWQPRLAEAEAIAIGYAAVDKVLLGEA